MTLLGPTYCVHIDDMSSVLTYGDTAVQTANKAAMLHQTPMFFAALHGQPESPPVTDSLIIVTFDAVAQRLCTRQHRARLCVLDTWETTKLGAPHSLSYGKYG